MTSVAILRRLLSTALLLLASLAASNAWAGCKFFEICGFTPNAPVQSVTSSAPDCISIDTVAPVVDNRGCVTFRACCENVILECHSDILVKVNGPGGVESAISAGWVCKGCFGKPAGPSDFPSPPCISDVCTAGGGDPGSPVDATACSTTVGVEAKSWSLVKVLYKE